jgi:hypothetical protein
VQPFQSGLWGGGQDANELLIDRLSAVSRVLDPVPPAVWAGARAAFAAAGDLPGGGAPDAEAG